MFKIRAARKTDLQGLMELARMVQFINLPPEAKFLKSLIYLSEKSFQGNLVEPSQGRFLFVLEDLKSKALVGTSQILAQHGTPEEPHLYFKVLTKKKKSKVLKKAITHQVLRLGFDYHGPTELGALMLSPKFRGHPKKLGLMLSYVRFMYMRARREFFQDDILVELMPPLTKDQDSPLWQAIGSKFTGLPYYKADRLSRLDKEFVTSLFPEGDLYVSMLPKEAQQAIGQVGVATEPVKRMLEKIGFRYEKMIDPFDGGPHYWAQTDRVLPLRQTQRVHLNTIESLKGDVNLKTQGLLMLMHGPWPEIVTVDSVSIQKTKSIPRLYLEAGDWQDDFKTINEAYFLEMNDD